MMNRLVILTAMLVLCAWGVAEAKEALVPEEHQQIVTVNRLRRADEASLHFRQRRSIDDVTRDSEEEEEEFRHPVYNITAFGRQMIIVLERDEKLVSPALTVSYTSSAPNVSCNITNPKRFPVKNCFYKGYVLDEEESSSVAMSICDSLIGSISTARFHYFIEPLKQDRRGAGGAEPVEHLIKRRDPADERQNPPTDKCGNSHHTSASYTKRQVDEKLEEVSLKRKKRDFNANEYFIEAMVVADKSLYDKYENDLEHYILTIMSGANRIFSHPSLGMVISIIVTKIVLLDEHTDLELVQAANPLLENFCSWQRTNHFTTDETDPGHYDLALLLTDIDICYASNCDTLGMGNMGGMCATGRSCVIVEDDGLSTSITVAHEIGHTFNMKHDDDPHCAWIDYENNVDPHVMRPSITEVLPSQPWSVCSRRDIARFFEQDRAHCLTNEPARQPFQYPDELPGHFYTEDQQCEMLLGRGSKACEIEELQLCSALWCEKVEKGKKTCITRSFNRADGTPCGDGMSCFAGTCRDESYRPTPVDGGWAAWQPYGTCSRTCGGGVRISTRDCVNPAPANGGRFCIGDRTRAQSCGTQRCPDPDADFRLQQCQRFNGQRPRAPVSSHVQEPAEWVPKYTGLSERDQCKLICTEVHTDIYVTWSYKVVDGTTCSPRSSDVCVQGKCEKAGCDHVLGSRTKLNKCGVCGGSRKSCKKQKGKYSRKVQGYSKVITFPVGASKISVSQKSGGEFYDGNYLALVDSDGNYLINGQMILNTMPRDISYGGTNIKYSGVGSRVETVRTDSPLKRPLTLEVLSQKMKAVHNDPRIKYTYYLPRVQKSRKQRKSKKANKKRKSKLRVKAHNLRPSVRSAVTRPAVTTTVATTTTTTTLAPAPTTGIRWVTGRWRKCKVPSAAKKCGSGFMKRTVLCKNGKAASNQCNNRVRPRNRQSCHVRCTTSSSAPSTNRIANRGAETGQWRYGAWGACSNSCGMGFKRRLVKCVDSRGSQLHASRCPASSKPSDTHGCKITCRS